MKPIAWYDPTNGMVSTDKDSPLFTPLGQVLPLYTQRTWVGLTKNEVETLSYIAEGNTWTAIELAEAKLKEKNSG
jgi:hypothetical protein